MTCPNCEGSGVVLLCTDEIVPCLSCEAGANRRIVSNRAAINRYRETMEPSDLQSRLDAIRETSPVVVKSTLPSLRPVYRKYHAEWAFAAGFVFCALLRILWTIFCLGRV